MSNEAMLEHLLFKFNKDEVISFCKVASEFYDVLCKEHYKTSQEPCEDEYDSNWWGEAYYMLLESNSTNYFKKKK